MRRLDPDEMVNVSDNEEESPVPTLGTFMNIQSALRQSAPDILSPEAFPPTRAPNQGSGLVRPSLSPSPPGMCGIDSPPSNLPPSALGWQELMSRDITSGPAINQLPKSAHINYQSMGPIYSPEEVAKNTQLLDMTDILNTILQMAYNKLYIPLSLLTTPSLSKIHMNDNLKFRKIPFGNGISKQLLNESLFPTENSLTETSFFQAYRNWL